MDISVLLFCVHNVVSDILMIGASMRLQDSSRIERTIVREFLRLSAAKFHLQARGAEPWCRAYCNWQENVDQEMYFLKRLILWIGKGGVLRVFRWSHSRSIWWLSLDLVYDLKALDYRACSAMKRISAHTSLTHVVSICRLKDLHLALNRTKEAAVIFDQ